MLDEEHIFLRALSSAFSFAALTQPKLHMDLIPSTVILSLFIPDI